MTWWETLLAFVANWLGYRAGQAAAQQAQELTVAKEEAHVAEAITVSVVGAPHDRSGTVERLRRGTF